MRIKQENLRHSIMVNIPYDLLHVLIKNRILENFVAKTIATEEEARRMHEDSKVKKEIYGRTLKKILNKERKTKAECAQILAGGFFWDDNILEKYAKAHEELRIAGQQNLLR